MAQMQFDWRPLRYDQFKLMRVCAQSIGPGGSAALIQARWLTRVGHVAQRPGPTVCFMLFIEKGCKSSLRLHRGLGWDRAEQGHKDDCFAAGWGIHLCAARLQGDLQFLENK